MITGKNKERFKKFYETIKGGNYKIPYQNFMAYPFEMKQGVLLAYYRSIGVYIHTDLDSHWNIDMHSIDFHKYYEGFETFEEALTEAFKQADKLENERLNK